jgi:hypothetical protein
MILMSDVPKAITRVLDDQNSATYLFPSSSYVFSSRELFLL